MAINREKHVSRKLPGGHILRNPKKQTSIKKRKKKSKYSICSTHHPLSEDHYLRILLQLESLLINILTLIRNNNPRINGAGFFSSLQKEPSLFINQDSTKHELKQKVRYSPEVYGHMIEGQLPHQGLDDREHPKYFYNSCMIDVHKLPLP